MLKDISNDADHIFLFDFHQELKSLLKQKRDIFSQVCLKVKGLERTGATKIYWKLFTASEKIHKWKRKMELSQNPSQQSPRVRLNLNSDIENIENLTLGRFYISINTGKKKQLSLHESSVERRVKSVFCLFKL